MCCVYQCTLDITSISEEEISIKVSSQKDDFDLTDIVKSYNIYLLVLFNAGNVKENGLRLDTNNDPMDWAPQ